MEWIAADFHTSHSAGVCERDPHGEKGKLKIMDTLTLKLYRYSPQVLPFYTHIHFWMLLPVKKNNQQQNKLTSEM